MLMIMKLLHDYVAIKPDKPEEKTESGLYLQEEVKTYPPFGTIEAVSSSITNLKKGDRVLYKVYASVDINKDLAVVPYECVIAILDEKSH